MGGAYSPTPVAYPTPRTRPPSAGTAETLVLVALVLQVIAAVVILGLFLLLFGFAAFHSDRATWVFALVASVVGGLSLLFLYCAYQVPGTSGSNEDSIKKLKHRRWCSGSFRCSSV